MLFLTALIVIFNSSAISFCVTFGLSKIISIILCCVWFTPFGELFGELFSELW